MSRNRINFKKAELEGYGAWNHSTYAVWESQVEKWNVRQKRERFKTYDPYYTSRVHHNAL